MPLGCVCKMRCMRATRAIEGLISTLSSTRRVLYAYIKYFILHTVHHHRRDMHVYEYNSQSKCSPRLNVRRD